MFRSTPCKQKLFTFIKVILGIQDKVSFEEAWQVFCFDITLQMQPLFSK